MTQRSFNKRASTVAIDARAISHPQPGGFKTYSENLVKHLPALDDSLSFEILLDRPVANLDHVLRPNVSVKVIRAAIPFLGVPIRENVVLPIHLVNSRVDLVHFPNASAALWSPRPFVITIHDAIELMSISTEYGGSSVKRNLMHLYNRHNQKLAARKAEAIITVSQCSKRDIGHWLNVSEDRIFVTYEAPDEAFSRIADASQMVEVRRKYGLEQKYILGIGSADARKNILGLIRAYSQLPSELIARYQLAIVMTHQRLQESLHSLTKKLGVTDRVRYLTAVPNADLAGVYSGAGLFVFPSLYEGFGLPPLEAMACGAPVIAASNSCIAEILGEAAVLVKDVHPTSDLAELTRKMAQVLNDPLLRFSLSQLGLAHARSFSWARCARETLNVYDLALEKSRSKQVSQSGVRLYQ